MFAIEIEFSDGISLPEIIFVRRTSAILGSGETAHVLIEASQQTPDIRVTRGLGRQFRTDVARRPTDDDGLQLSAGLVGKFENHGDIQFGSVRIHIVALDVDLIMEPDETPDSGAIRILKNALTYPSPLFPAVAVLGGVPVLLSFSSRQPVTIGRSRNCLVRFDSSGVSSEHARIGCEGGRCWIEDLGSTNGTFVGGAPIEGRRPLDVESVISLGNEVSLAVVYRVDDISRLQNKSVSQSGPQPTLPERTRPEYPILFSKNEHVRPSRFVLAGSGKLTVGRDPANDIWINTPHVSRCHLQFEWNDEGRLRILDESSNGTYVDGVRLPRGALFELKPDSRNIDLGAGVELHVAHNEAEEQEIIESIEQGVMDRDYATPLKPISPLTGSEGALEAETGFFAAPPTMMETRNVLPVAFNEDADGAEEDEVASGLDFLNKAFPIEEESQSADPWQQSDTAPQEAEQFQLLEDNEEPLGLGSNFSRVLLLLFIVLLVLFSGLVFLGFFADKYFY